MQYEARKRDGSVVAEADSQGELVDKLVRTLPREQAALIVWYGDWTAAVLVWSETDEGNWVLYRYNTEDGSLTVAPA